MALVLSILEHTLTSTVQHHGQRLLYLRDSSHQAPPADKAGQRHGPPLLQLRYRPLTTSLTTSVNIMDGGCYNCGDPLHQIPPVDNGGQHLMIDLLGTFDLWRIVPEVLVDGKVERSYHSCTCLLSGSIVRVKFRLSSASGNVVFVVDPRDNSLFTTYRGCYNCRTSTTGINTRAVIDRPTGAGEEESFFNVTVFESSTGYIPDPQKVAEAAAEPAVSPEGILSLVPRFLGGWDRSRPPTTTHFYPPTFTYPHDPRYRGKVLGFVEGVDIDLHFSRLDTVEEHPDFKSLEALDAADTHTYNYSRRWNAIDTQTYNYSRRWTQQTPGPTFTQGAGRR
ncbi:hypothetical protein AYO21_11472 [Fonsecaea monophora]|uniref:Uncharacterized protein n=1 Tax=Fonsecaea monophora TaxID=254056 RepID=A0A177ERW0_9EURO|nr:hypothetical protein AYO21_11472 [Fonsecaea monophora]OAG34386.1 hypothetical protein AYO21_11472 [Fonsecaea monophora]